MTVRVVIYGACTYVCVYVYVCMYVCVYVCSFVLCDANDDLVSVEWLLNQLLTERAKAAVAR